MRTVTKLLSLQDTVWVYLESEALCRRFLKDAEAEGFTFGDGVRPTGREGSDLFALRRDLTLSYLGFIGHMAFFQGETGKDAPARVDYGRYLAGRDDYVLTQKGLRKLREERLERIRREAKVRRFRERAGKEDTEDLPDPTGPEE